MRSGGWVRIARPQGRLAIQGLCIHLGSGAPTDINTKACLLYTSYLHLDMGELDTAAEEAKKGYAAADPKQDFILMASSRKVQCMVENARVEEEVEGWADHAVSAQDYARDAVELAGHTQDRRLLATVYTWYGLTMSNAFFGDKERAREAMEKAATYIEPGTRDYLWNCLLYTSRCV